MMGARMYGAAAVIVVNLADEDMTVPVARNLSEYGLPDPIPMYMVTEEDGAMLEALPSSATVQAKSVSTVSHIDPNIVLFIVIAVGCMVLGSLWAHTRNPLLLHGTSAWLWPSHDDDVKASRAAGTTQEEETMRVTPRTVVIFVGASCGMLLALYFLYKLFFYIILSIFCLVASIGTQRVLDLLVACLPIRLPALPLTLPLVGRLTLWSMLCAALAVGLTVCWAVYRKASNAWIGQDMLSICFLLSTIQFIRLPSLKIASILLGAFLLYDVFFVFVTPLITSSHDSVMVTAATGGSGNDETLPLVIIIPRFSLPRCLSGSSMLGFGDIIMPSLLVSFCRGVDLSLRPRHPDYVTRTASNAYFLAGVLGYVLGLLLTYGALMLTNAAQPALLYLVPCTLGATWLVGWRRGQLGMLLDGSVLSDGHGDTSLQAAGTDKGDMQTQPLLSQNDAL